MKRAERLQMVQRVVDDQERRRAETLAGSERRLRESETKLAELQNYYAGYVREFAARAESGMDGGMARDYQAFLSRLDEALRQQAQAVVRARAQRDGELQIWQGAAQRAEGVGQMVRRFLLEDARALDRVEQFESDERAQHALTYGLLPRGA